MDLTKYAKVAEKFVIDNSPTIFSAIGVAGSLGTAYLTGKATFKAAQLIAEKQHKLNLENASPTPHILTKAEKVGLVWKVYVLPAGAGLFTCASIVAANRISASRMAALAAGYTMLDSRFEDYRNKVLEKVGIKKEEDIRTEAAQQRTDENPPPTTMVITDGKTLFRDEFTGRYFESTMEDIRRAVNDVNFKVIEDEYAVLTDFYERIGLPPTSISEEYGWTVADKEKFALLFNTVIWQGKPVITIDYVARPIHNGYTGGGSQKLHAL